MKQKFSFCIEFSDLPSTIDGEDVEDEIFRALNEKGFDVEKVELIENIKEDGAR